MSFLVKTNFLFGNLPCEHRAGVEILRVADVDRATWAARPTPVQWRTLSWSLENGSADFILRRSVSSPPVAARMTTMQSPCRGAGRISQVLFPTSLNAIGLAVSVSLARLARRRGNSAGCRNDGAAAAGFRRLAQSPAGGILQQAEEFAATV